MKQVRIEPGARLEIGYALDDSQAHHLFDVLRTSPKETIRILSGSQAFTGHVLQKPFVICQTRLEEEARELEMTLCAALIKQDKFEWMLQKAAELGVTRIVPFTCKNSIIKLDANKRAKKMERWNSILNAACAQCNRSDTIALEEVCALADLEKYKAEISVVAYEKEDTRHLCQALSTPYTSVCGVIGPEGGFEKEEVSRLEQMGFVCSTLGPDILRAETAACYFLSAASYQFFQYRMQQTRDTAQAEAEAD